MSTVILKIEDSEDGQINIETDFYPELKTDGTPTGAQYLALIALKAMSDEAKK